MGAAREKAREVLRDQTFRKSVVTLVMTVLQILILRRPPSKPG